MKNVIDAILKATFIIVMGSCVFGACICILLMLQ